MPELIEMRFDMDMAGRRRTGRTGMASVAVPRRELEAFRLGSRQGWERCIESLKDYRGDGLVTDDMVAWLEKEMKEDCG